MVRNGMVWYDKVWYGTVRYGSNRIHQTRDASLDASDLAACEASDHNILSHAPTAGL